MRRFSLALFSLFLLLAAQAAAQAPRPSINSVDAAQKRTNAAICAKADADGDSYRPFVCDPRCDCLAPFLIQTAPTVCDESSPGVFDVAAPGAPTCSNGFCVGVGGNFCTPGGAGCFPGQQCVTTCAFTICISRCVQPCTSDAVCPPIPGPVARLSGVSPPDSPNAVECMLLLNPADPASGTTQKINSNDALECIEQVEADVACD